MFLSVNFASIWRNEKDLDVAVNCDGTIIASVTAAAAGNVTNEILFSEYKKAERGLFKNFDCYV